MGITAGVEGIVEESGTFDFEATGLDETKVGGGMTGEACELDLKATELEERCWG